MIVIVVKFTVRPEHDAAWPELVRPFTKATRAEPGNLFFEWSRSLEVEHQYVLVEGFADGAAEAHVTSAHFREATTWMGDVVAGVPEIISVAGVPGDGWGPMGEVQPRG